MGGLGGGGTKVGMGGMGRPYSSVEDICCFNELNGID